MSDIERFAVRADRGAPGVLGDVERRRDRVGRGVDLRHLGGLVAHHVDRAPVGRRGHRDGGRGHRDRGDDRALLRVEDVEAIRGLPGDIDFRVADDGERPRQHRRIEALGARIERRRLRSEGDLREDRALVGVEDRDRVRILVHHPEGVIVLREGQARGHRRSEGRLDRRRRRRSRLRIRAATAREGRPYHDCAERTHEPEPRSSGPDAIPHDLCLLLHERRDSLIYARLPAPPRGTRTPSR